MKFKDIVLATVIVIIGFIVLALGAVIIPIMIGIGAVIIIALMLGSTDEDTNTSE